MNDPTVFRRDCFKPNCATTLFNQRDSAPATQSPAPCPYANICETCDNYITGPEYITAPEFRGALTDQLADIHALKADAETRGWTDEAACHDCVAHTLTDHLDR